MSILCFVEVKAQAPGPSLKCNYLTEASILSTRTGHSQVGAVCRAARGGWMASFVGWQRRSLQNQVFLRAARKHWWKCHCWLQSLLPRVIEGQGALALPAVLWGSRGFLAAAWRIGEFKVFNRSVSARLSLKCPEHSGDLQVPCWGQSQPQRTAGIPCPHPAPGNRE